MANVLVFGHQNPDNDAIMSAVVLSQLLNQECSPNTNGFCRMTLSGRALNYIHPVNRAFSQVFDSDDLTEKGIISIRTNGFDSEGVSLSSAQGDRNVLAALSRFGARIVRSTNAATVQSDKLAGFEMSAHDIPDLVPVISAVASLAQGRTFIRDCARLRIKESDRLATTTRELTALGAQVRIAGDDLIIKGVDAFTGGEVDSHNDHRIAMMAAIAASRATGEVVIHGAEAVNKSYPDFFDHYRLLGGKVTLEEE